MIQKSEKKLIHIYAHAAGLTDPEYRAILQEITGKFSCADMEFSHADCDRALAALEGVLFDRVARGLMPSPLGRSRFIRSEWHFRERVARVSSGLLSPRHEHRILQLWSQLSEFLDDPRCRDDYLAAIVRKSTGVSKPLAALTRSEAQSVLNALSDRLRYALKTSLAAAVPF